MTRKTWLKSLITLWPLALLGAKKPEKVCFPVRDIWQTPQGQYVLALRAELKRLDHWDDLAEDWKEVEKSLNAGHMFFQTFSSRWTKTRERHRLLYSIRPAFMNKTTIDNIDYLVSSPTNPNQPSRPRL